jgi:hypothetical protein
MIKKITSFLTIVALFVVSSGILNPFVASAASITSFSDTVTDLTASANANHTIVFTTPTGVASGQTIILTFNNSTVINASLTFADVDVLDGASQITLAAAPSGATAGVVRTSATVLTFTNGTTAITAGHVITIKIGTNASNQSTGTFQVANGSVGTTTLSISGTFTDTGSLAIPIISNGVVAISATVQPTITFALSANSIYFGNLTSASTCFAQNTNPGSVTCPTTAEAEAFNATAATNSPSGYTITVQGATLTSGANTITALASNTAASAGTEQFGMRATASGGSGTVTAPYAASGFAYTGTASTPAQVASATAASATTTYSIRYVSDISATTKAGSYTTNHTYVATGNF